MAGGVQLYDIAIIGGGPAGITAAVYAARAGYTPAVFEKLYLGGQLASTNEIENYPGVGLISGFDLIAKFNAHLSNFGHRIISSEVTGVQLKDDIKTIQTADNAAYEARALIITAGAVPRALNVKGESEFIGRGVSYCATCDGNFYRGKTTAVVGGGNTAVHDALFLSNICETVYIIHRRDTFRADNRIVQKMKQTPNIKLVTNSILKEIKGDKNVEAIVLTDDRVINADGVFIAVGTAPSAGFLKDLPGVSFDETGAVITNERMETGAQGVFAAGDVRNTPLRQIITAAADGAVAAHYAAEYLIGKGT